MNVGVKHDGYLFFVRRNLLSKKKLLEKMGVRKNTFAGNLISRLYDYFFSNSLSLRKEYRRYYKNEFETITDFIEQRYDLDHKEAKMYSSGHFYVKDCVRGNFEKSVTTLLLNEDFKEMIFDALGGIVDEDKDWFYY